MSRLSETVLGEAALAWHENASWEIRNDTEIATGTLRVTEAEPGVKEATV